MYMHIYIYICIYTYIHTYIYVYVYIHMYCIFTPPHSRPTDNSPFCVVYLSKHPFPHITNSSGTLRSADTQCVGTANTGPIHTATKDKGRVNL